MEKDWNSVPTKRRPRIEMLSSTAYWEIGDRFTIKTEDDDYLGFIDNTGLPFYINKTNETVEFIYVRKGV